VSGAAPRWTPFGLALAGGAAALFQILFSRAFLTAFSGNEAVLAALLCAWLVATAAGAAIGARRTAPGASAALLTFGPAAVCAIFAARVLPRFFPAGSPPGTVAAFASALLLLAPACLLAGIVFARLASIGPGGRAYCAESLGSALAGAAASLFVLGRVGDFTAAAAMVALSSAAALPGLGRRAPWAAVAGAAFSITTALAPLGPGSLALQAPRFAQVLETPTDSGTAAVASTPGQTTLFIDRVPVAALPDAAAAEEAAHIPLSFHPAPRTVAVVGLPPPEALPLMFRHGVIDIDLTAGDPAFARLLAETFPPLREARLHLHGEDPRRFLRSRHAAYDAVLVFSPSPVSALHDRLFTAEFDAEIRAALRPGGLAAVALPGHAQLASEETRRLHSAVARTLESVFGKVVVLPAGRTFYVATPDPPSDPAGLVERRLAERGIAPLHLVPSRLRDLFSSQRLSDADRWSSLPMPADRDLAPTTYALGLDRALAEFGDQGLPALIALALALALAALLVYAPRSRPYEFAVMGSGAFGLGAQLVLMLVYQMALGSLYRELGLPLAGFLAGAAAGAFVGNRFGHGAVVVSDLGQAALAGLLWLLLPTLVHAGDAARPALFAATAAAGLLPGLQFAAASRARGGAAASLYAADLTGAAIASLLVFTIAVPALGLRGTLLAAGAFKLAGAAIWLLPARQADLRPQARPLISLVPASLAAWVLATAADRTHASLYAFTFLRPYQWVAVGLILLSLAIAFEPAGLRRRRVALERRLVGLRVGVGTGVVRLAHHGLLLPVAGSPLGRCYFAIPYVFCHTCPRPCVFGVLRPYVVPAALVANLHDRRFCEQICPLGTVQDACGRMPARRARPLPALRVLRILALIFVGMAWFMARIGHGEGIQGGGWYTFFFRNSFAAPATALWIAAALLVLSLFVRRPFCDALCPIGAATGLFAMAERSRLLTNRGGTGEPDGA